MNKEEAIRKMNAAKRIILGIMVGISLLLTFFIFLPSKLQAAENQNIKQQEKQKTTTAEAIKFLGGTIAAAIAVGLGSIGAGQAVQKVGSASIGAIVEKPELFGRTILYVGLAEGIAIYGIIVALLILFKI